MQTLENEIGTQVQIPAGVSAMLDRAAELYQEAYWLQVTGPATVLMHKAPTRPGRYPGQPYRLDLAAWTCDCESFTGPKPYRLNTGRRTCKHLEGFHHLAATLAANKMMEFEAMAVQLNGTASNRERRDIHMGATLEGAYGEDPARRQADVARKTAMQLRTMMERFPQARGRRAGERREAA